MIKGVLTNGHHRVLLLGLGAENMARLAIDQPIALNAAQVGLTPQPILIVGGADEEAILEYVAASGARLALFDASPPDDDQPPPRPPTEADYAAAEAGLMALPAQVPHTAGWLATAALNAAYAARVNLAAGGKSFTCPRCLMVSQSPDDVTNRYCGACHAFTGARNGL